MVGKLRAGSTEAKLHTDPKWDDVDAEIIVLRALRGCKVAAVKDAEGAVIGERDSEGNIRQAVSQRSGGQA